jgi:hypothetical protein
MSGPVLLSALVTGFLVIHKYPAYGSEISPYGADLELPSYSKSQTLRPATESAFVWLTHLPCSFHAVSLASSGQGHAYLDTLTAGRLEII